MYKGVSRMIKKVELSNVKVLEKAYTPTTTFPGMGCTGAFCGVVCTGIACLGL